MPITAQFTADTSQFTAEVKKAESEVRNLEVTTTKTGGVILQFSDKTKTAEGGFKTFNTAAKSVDASLASVGVNIGPATRAIEEIGNFAGKSATALGSLQTAGAVLAAGIAGWQIGRKIAESLNTDKWIGDSIAKWMGWGDVAEQEAGAVADALLKASLIAKRPITDINEALRINTQELKNRTTAAKEHNEELEKWERANEAVVVATQNHSRVLATINGQTVEAAKAALSLGVSQQNVATAYKLTASEIAAIVDLMKKEAVELDIVKKKNEEVAAAMKTHWDGVGDVLDEIFGTKALTTATQWVDAINSMGMAVTDLHREPLEKLKEAMLAGINALARSGQLTSSQTQEFVRLAYAADQALQALKPVVKVEDDLVKAQWEYALATDAALKAAANVPEGTKPAKEAVDQLATSTRLAESGFLGLARAMEPFGGGATGGVSATEGTKGWTPFVPKLARGGLMPFLPLTPGEKQGLSHLGSIVFNITQPLGTPDAIANVVGAALAAHYRQGGNRLPA